LRWITAILESVESGWQLWFGPPTPLAQNRGESVGRLSLSQFALTDKAVNKRRDG